MRKKEQNYMEIARALIRELEALNNVRFGKQSCDIVFRCIKDRDDSWIAEIDELQTRNHELTELAAGQHEAMEQLRTRHQLAVITAQEKEK